MNRSTVNPAQLTLSGTGDQRSTAIALIDGEHYLPVTKAALDKIAQEYDLKAAVFIGGTEKIADDSELKTLDIEVLKEEKAEPSLIKALERFKPETVIDLSDEPVLDYKRRFKLASITLKNNVSYIGADFTFKPPLLEPILTKPSLAIIGTGKRVGKTAVSSYISRLLKKKYNPLIVAMGRGGPAEPEILEGDKIELTPQVLLEAARAGKHAASDYYEDALTSRVRTIGCRRAGGGLAGQPFISNVLKGARLANELDNDLVILEGSGSTIPPVKADKSILIIGGYQRFEDIAGYFGPYRILLADLVIMTMCEEPLTTKEHSRSLQKAVSEINPDCRVIKTVFKPKPLGTIESRKVFVATTAKEGLANIRKHLEEQYKCQVVAMSNKLSNRPALQAEISKSPSFEVMLTELKAAAVDVATQVALDQNKEVVYMDNNLHTVDGANIDEVIFNLMQAL